MSKINYTRLIKYAGGGYSIDPGASPSRFLIKPWSAGVIPLTSPSIASSPVAIDTPTDDARDKTTKTEVKDKTIRDEDIVNKETGEIDVEAIERKYGKDYFGSVSEEQFVKDMAPLITKITAGTGILPETAMTQFMLEQGIGQREGFGDKPAAGVRKSWNIGNIKMYGHYKGPYGSYIHNDDAPTDQFIDYPNLVAGIKGYTEFLMDNSNYKKAGVFDAKTAPDQLAAIIKAGYSTHPEALNNLINIYNRNFGTSKMGGGVANRIAEFRRGGLILYKNKRI